MLQVYEAVKSGQGFSLALRLSPAELEGVRGLIRAQWLAHIQARAPEHFEAFSELEMEHYHEKAHLLNHGQFWPKKARILPQSAVPLLRATSLFKALENTFGSFEISDEEAIGHEEIYWRLVRPNEPNDVGPLHADSWFWSLGHGTTPPHTQRVKVWIAIYCEPGLNGLRVVPDSYRKQWKYHGEYRDGFSKPQIDEREEDLNIQLLHTEPGNAVVFHDDLLHGGVINRGQRTRVSLEFTLFVREENWLKYREPASLALA